jgi:hypothetical protein
MPKLIIAVRPGPDWSTEDRGGSLHQSRAFCQRTRFPPEMMTQLVDAWDSAFQTTFFQARQRMKGIATSNWLTVEGAQVLDTNDWTLSDVPDDVWVAFVDDDDWFRPDIGRFLPDPRGLDGVVWQHSIFGWPDGDVIAIRDETGLCYTNNYAVTGRYLKTHGVETVLQHWDADRAFKELSVTRIGRVLSMTNGHAASAISLERAGRKEMAGERLLKATADYVARTADAPFPPAATWAWPMIAQVHGYFVQLIKGPPANTVGSTGSSNPARFVEGALKDGEDDLLTSLACQVHTGCIVEVGSWRGRSTVALAYGSKLGARAPVYAVDPHETFTGVLNDKYVPADRETFMRNILAAGFGDIVRLINLSSETVAVGWHKPIGLLWIDGDHSLEGTRRDFACWESFLLPGSMVAFHDSLNPYLGPYHVIRAALGTGRYELTCQEYLITVLRCLRRPRPARLRRLYDRWRALTA